MSGAEVLAGIGFAASIIQVVETCTKVLSRIQDFRRNIAFIDLASQLSLLVKDIEAINSAEYKKHLDQSTEEALDRVLEGCQRQLDKLDQLLKSMTSAKSTPKLYRTLMGMTSLMKETEIREITGVLSGYKSTINLHLASRRMQEIHTTAVASEAPRSFFEVPRLKVSNFIGREKLLEQIERCLDRGRSNPEVVVLAGVGGQGKTQIALEFCQRSSPKYKAIFWIDASAENCATRSFERIAAKLEMPNLSSSDGREKVAYAKDILRNWPAPWLLVFDNYDAPHSFRDVSSFFPTGAGTNQNAILITSRQLSCKRLGTGIDVGGFTLDEGVELLLSRYDSTQVNSKDLAECENIVKRLGYLALAIDQAAAYISSCKLPIRLFMIHYDKRKEHILRHTPGPLWEYQSKTASVADASSGNLSVLTTWELSFGQMSQDKEERRLLGQFLTQSAFFDSTNIKESLFRTFLKGSQQSQPDWTALFTSNGIWNPFRFQDAIAGLMNMSLVQTIRITAEESKFSLHPLIKEWLQLRSGPDLCKSFTFSSISMTAYLIEEQDPESISIETRQEILGAIDCSVANIQQHVQSIEDKFQYAGFVQGFQTTFATFYGQHDRYSDAIKLFQDILDCPWGNAEVTIPTAVKLRTMNNLCVVYLQTKQLSQAQDMLERTFREKEQLLGSEDPLTMNTINNIGNLYSMKGELGNAKEMYGKALDGYIKSYGQEHQAVVNAMSNLGEISLKLGNPEDAEQRFRVALEILRKLSPVENALALYINSNIALTYKLQGRHHDSIPVYKEVIAGREALFGNEHSSTLIAKCELGDTLMAAGHKEEAKQYYEAGKADSERRKRGLCDVPTLGEESSQFSTFKPYLDKKRVTEDWLLTKTLKWDGLPEIQAQESGTMGHGSSRWTDLQSMKASKDAKPDPATNSIESATPLERDCDGRQVENNSLACKSPEDPPPHSATERPGIGAVQPPFYYPGPRRLPSHSQDKDPSYTTTRDSLPNYVDGYNTNNPCLSGYNNRFPNVKDLKPRSMPYPLHHLTSPMPAEANNTSTHNPSDSMSDLRYPGRDQCPYSRAVSRQSITSHDMERFGAGPMQPSTNYIERFGPCVSQSGRSYVEHFGSNASNYSNDYVDRFGSCSFNGYYTREPTDN